jgi:zinc protease
MKLPLAVTNFDCLRMPFRNRLGCFLAVGLFAAALGLAPAPALAQTQTRTKTQTKPAAPKPAVPPGVRLVSQIPQPGPPHPFQFPPVASRTLPNGLRVFVVANHAVPAVTVALVLTDAGSIHDPKGLAGVAQMTASLLTQGTATRDAARIAASIDSVGGSLSAFTDHDDTTAVATVVSKDFPLAMDLLADVALHPSFPQQEIDRQRQQALSSLRVNYADAGYLATASFARMVYGSSAYGFPSDGTPQSLAAISRDDIEHFHQATYGPAHALLAFAGDVTPEEAFAAASQYFGSWAQPPAAPTPPSLAPPAITGLHFLLIDKPDAVQTQIRVGRPGVARKNPDYIPLLVTNRVFGGGYNSLLNTAVRLKKGLTYGASSAFDARRFGGSFVAGTFTRTEKTVDAMKLIVELMQSMASGQITDADLALARDYLVGVYPIQTETPDQVVTRVLTVAEYGLPDDYNQTYQQKVAAVTLERVKEMAARYFAAKDLDVVLVGNVSAFRAQLKQAFPGASLEEIPVKQLDLLLPKLHREEAKLPAPTAATLDQGHIALQTAVHAAGGDALASVKTIRVTESGHVLSPQGDIAMDETYQLAFPNRIHSDLSLLGQSFSQIYDGQNGWMSTAQGSAELPPALLENLRRRILLTEGIGIYQAVLAGKVQAQWIGEQQVQDRKLFALAAKTDVGPITLFVDPETRLVVGAGFTASTAAGKVETVELWSDFRPVAGLQLPFHIVGYQSGAKYMETIVKDIQVNVPVDPAAFAKPQPKPASPAKPHPGEKD